MVHRNTSTTHIVKKLILAATILLLNCLTASQVFALTYGECGYGEGTYNQGCTTPSAPGSPSTTSPTNSSVQTWVWTAATDTGSTIASYAWRVTDSLGQTIESGTTAFTQVTTNLAEGVWNFFVKAINTFGNEGAESQGSVIVDQTGASITNVAASPTSTTVQITWDTDVNASSQVEYGVSTAYGSSTPETDTSPGVTSHVVDISSLTSCTSYHYRVLSTDSVGNQRASTDQTFNTTGCVSPSPEATPFPSPTPVPSSTPTPIPQPNSSGDSSPSAPSPAQAPTCTDAVPVGEPDFFQTNRNKSSATLFFTPVNDNVERYHVVFGLWQGDERFGSLSTHVTRETNNGVQSLTISDLDPKSEYWFKVAPVNGCAVGTWSTWMKAGKWKNRESFFYKYFGL